MLHVYISQLSLCFNFTGEVTVDVEEVLLTSAEPSVEVSITTLNDEITEADKEFALVASAALELTFDPPQLVDYASATVTVFEDDGKAVSFGCPD